MKYRIILELSMALIVVHSKIKMALAITILFDYSLHKVPLGASIDHFEQCMEAISDESEH